jgi:hypothetical protein
MFSTTFIRKIVPLRSIQWHIIINLPTRSPNYPLLLSDFSYFRICEKYSDIKFHENPSFGSRAVPCGQTGKQIDMTWLTDAFCSFANSPEWLKRQRNWRQAVNRNCLLTHEFCLISLARHTLRPSCPLLDNVLRRPQFVKISIMQFFL